MTKRFFYVCAGLFLLTLTYHVGARSADAQAPSNPVVSVAQGSSGGLFVAVTSNGASHFTPDYGTSWTYRGNVFGAPTAAANTSWGRVKSGYQK